MELFVSDVGRLDNLPEDWADQIVSVVDALAYSRAFDDTAPTAREKLAPGDKIETKVVNGDQIAQSAAWLTDLYGADLVQLASELTGREVQTGREQISNVNINVMSGVGGRYEKHVDTNHLTGIWFVTTLAPDAGGFLCFETEEGVQQVRAEAGKIVFFDARDVPHYVTALQTQTTRIVVVMNFFFKDEAYSRPDVLNRYIYTASD
ncbi:2OG-Fe(II) oxygenase [Roseobacter sp. YSTF-M11]|uniref:2OG-Fe(II) oxygenase n=1 Tax=Roseobacter insulae TaxID=2859783 RepID=A0A9X1FX38_9RHOB|nr:2OG-Fe(II) oxygenase [Roseobacter insulae]MBW4708994.1 2OG-Fe(II) oxygenase [Roseobacter insulae]